MDQPLFVDPITSYVERDPHPERRQASHGKRDDQTPQALPRLPIADASQMRFDDAPAAHTSTATFDALLFVNRWADRATKP